MSNTSALLLYKLYILIITLIGNIKLNDYELIN